MQFVPYDLDKPQVQQDLAILVALFRLKPDERRLIAEAFGPNVLKIADKLSADQGGWRP